MYGRGEKGFSLPETKKRVAYAAKALKSTSPTFWADNVLIYLDAVSFVHKRNPYQDVWHQQPGCEEHVAKVWS